ncbi:hypothetical protein [Pengzhenrongella phosphoraccumulans]|uniref:hypothetical protein n=1 Tax=Pengzhenrongella phosphoraccumulans TaxID=3114394 RepID=UPI003890B0DB
MICRRVGEKGERVTRIEPRALVDPPVGEYAWRRFMATWEASVGDHLLRARATDEGRRPMLSADRVWWI